MRASAPNQDPVPRKLLTVRVHEPVERHKDEAGHEAVAVLHVFYLRAEEGAVVAISPHHDDRVGGHAIARRFGRVRGHRSWI